MSQAPHSIATHPFLDLLRHDTWATRKVLDLCGDLSHEQFHREFEIGHATLHANLTHMVGAMRRWADRVAQRHLRPSIEKPPEFRERSPLLLTELLSTAAADLESIALAIVADGSSSKLIAFTFQSPEGLQSINVTRQAALLHVATHGQHHRSQCFNMLRHLDRTIDSGDFDVIEWYVQQQRGNS
ncbi:MAG: hypothetical protein H7Y88_02380 [Phycisphaerales bacterium]|nr:hypothetical protein [Phycisphaerales bacterium]